MNAIGANLPKDDSLARYSFIGIGAPERIVIVPSELFGPNVSAISGFNGSCPCVALWIMYAVWVGV